MNVNGSDLRLKNYYEESYALPKVPDSTFISNVAKKVLEENKSEDLKRCYTPKYVSEDDFDRKAVYTTQGKAEILSFDSPEVKSNSNSGDEFEPALNSEDVYLGDRPKIIGFSEDVRVLNYGTQIGGSQEEESVVEIYDGSRKKATKSPRFTENQDHFQKEKSGIELFLLQSFNMKDSKKISRVLEDYLHDIDHLEALFQKQEGSFDAFSSFLIEKISNMDILNPKFIEKIFRERAGKNLLQDLIKTMHDYHTLPREEFKKKFHN